MAEQEFRNEWARPIWVDIEGKVESEMRHDTEWLSAKFRDSKKTFREAGGKKIGRSVASFAASHIPVIGPLMGKAISFIPADEINDGRQLQMASYYSVRAQQHVEQYLANSNPEPNVGKSFRAMTDKDKLEEYKNILVNVMRCTVELAGAKAKIEALEQASQDSFKNLIHMMEQDCSEDMRKLVPVIEIEMQDLSKR
ncbi:hypothetical protein C2869_14155 [Saccharobesus litoralis]|uniref:Uncharacterized protein n=1 Tax=Saccharobesus litoralis TaxID=2172099 RepID=A0A2S0VTK6_9ALTE|nr:hypothetical protein [Saccharobesus litoralis]AWB67512.1 hypothetical protein C2869_14155 [Saccharobesus litoralis]